MAEVFGYADETGDLDMSGSTGSSRYFGFGTAVFPDGHGRQLWEGLRLRCRLEQSGIRLPRGMHAKDDSRATRSEVFELIGRQGPRLDTTFLRKGNAYERVKSRGPTYLYKPAWYLHFKEIVRQVSRPGDTVFVVAGSLQTHNKRQAIRNGLEEVCDQLSHDRDIVPCIWDAPSSWGIQVADHGLGAAQRIIEGRECPWYEPCVRPHLRSFFAPWGTA